MNENYKCDICGIEAENVLAGRWIFYCPEHKHNDWEKTCENELSSGNGFLGNDDDIVYALSDGELSTMILENL